MVVDLNNNPGLGMKPETGTLQASALEAQVLVFIRQDLVM